MEKTRVEKLEDLLEQWEVDSLLIDDLVDIYYLTGKSLSFGKLIIEKGASTLFADARYYAEIVGKVPLLLHLYKQEEFFAILQEKNRLGFDAAKTTVASFQKIESLPKAFVPITLPLQGLRAQKDAAEIALIKEACLLVKRGYHMLQKHAKEGITEKQLARIFLDYLADHGAESSFPPNISFGENAAYPHHHPSDKKLLKDAAILVDIGAKVAGYCSDMTRVFFCGQGCKETAHLYDIAQKAYHKAASYCKEGALTCDLDAAAREELAKYDMEEFFTHSLGHGVGLEIHEYPTLAKKGRAGDTRLLSGMVITIEPGLYLPGKAGARYENTLLVTKYGYENLLAS